MSEIEYRNQCAIAAMQALLIRPEIDDTKSRYVVKEAFYIANLMMERARDPELARRE